MVTNGNVPTSQMRQVDGWAWLAPGAAAAWQLFAFKVQMATGRRPTITSPDGAYRSYARQVWWKVYYTARGQGYLAAKPGTSNHGLGLAIDIGNYAAYNHATLVSIATACGFRFDVSGEAWHIHYIGAPNYSTASTGTPTTITTYEEEPTMRWFGVRGPDGNTLLGVTIGEITYTEVDPNTDPVEYALERDTYSYPAPLRWLSAEEWRITKKQIDKRRALSRT